MHGSAFAFAFVVALAACPSGAPLAPTAVEAAPTHAPSTSATAPPTTSAGSTASLAAAFGIDRPATGCRTFDVQATDGARTRVLDIHVDTEQLGLRAGEHVLALDTPSPHVSVEILEHAASLHGETFCTDAGTPNQPAVVERWTAVAGRLEFSLAVDPGPNDRNELDLELVDVTFRNDRGDARTVHARFDDLFVGWLPG